MLSVISGFCYWSDGSLWLFDTCDGMWHVCARSSYGTQAHDKLAFYACGGETPPNIGQMVVKFERVPVQPDDKLCTQCKVDHITNRMRRA